MKVNSLLASLFVLPISTAVFASGAGNVISKVEVISAQEDWCNAVVHISQTYEEKGHQAAEMLAREVIDNAYGYEMGSVLFKPTLTVNPQTFRLDSEGALSYFVGGNDTYPQDSGFALKNWTECRIDNAGILVAGNSVNTLGKVHFTNAAGEVTSVDKTWTFVKDAEGQLRITLHHSSLEYVAN